MRKIYYLLILTFTFGIASAQEQLSKEEKERREKNIQAGNPFARFGYKAKVATLSKGKYLEVHDLDSIVTIGTIRWHVDKEQIVGNIVIDSLNPDAQPIGDITGRWISPDPLSEEFPDWSPYNFVMNSPLKYNDPTGMAPELASPPGDYFDTSGNYLGSDNVDDKKIYITSNFSSNPFSTDYSIFNTPKGFYNNDGTVNEGVAQSVSKEITKVSPEMKNNVAGNIINHYYTEAGYNLKELKYDKVGNTEGGWVDAMAQTRVGGLTRFSEYLKKGEMDIVIDHSALGRTMMNGYDVMNLISHERGKHWPDLKSSGMSLGKWSLENRATLFQLQHPTWSKTSPEFRNHIKTHQGTYLYQSEFQKYFK